MFPSLAVRTPRSLSCATLFAMMLALSACGGGGGVGGSTAAAPPTAGVQAPAITTQPAPQSVAVGQAATFTVAASGDGLSYQWQRNGADIAGATAATYVLNNAQAADDGSRFTVVVRNAGGSTTSAAATLQVKVGQLSLLAGTLGGAGQMDGPVGRFNRPANVVSSPSGELWLNDYFLPSQSLELRKISQAPGAAPTVTTLPHKDPFVNVIGAVDAAGNRYENWYLAIHKTTPAGVRTLLAGNPRAPGSADGAGIDAGFGAISGMAVDAGGALYVADRANATIRKVSPAGVVTTLAGSAGLTGSQDGTGAAARFRKPGALVLDKAGNVYVLDDDTVLRKMTPAGVVTTVATVPRWISSSGYPDMAEPNASAPVVGGLAVGDDGSVYVLSGNIRRVSPAGAVTNFAGDPFTWRAGATMGQDAAGNMYVVAPNQPVVFRVTPAGEIGAFAGLPAAAEDTYGNNIAQRIRFGRVGLYADAQGNVTYVDGGKVRRVTAGGAVSTFAGPAFDDNAYPNTYSVTSLAYGKDLLVYANGTLRSVNTVGNTTGILASVSNGLRDGPKGVASLNSPTNFLADSKGNIYFLDTVTGNVPTIVTQPSSTYVRRISPDGAIATLRDASQDSILHWIADKDGNILFGSVDGVKRMTPDGAVSTLYARPADLDPLAFYGPMALDRSGNLYIASDGVLRKITPAGTVSIVAGTAGVLGVRLGALPGTLNEVSALTVGDDGVIYLQSENAVLKLTQ